MNCAKCSGTLEPQRYGDDIVVHRCDHCAGLFVKPDMLEAMKQARLSEAVLDTGDPKVGKTLDRVGDIACPECGQCMVPTADERQTHIWFERCPNCEGIWLDAGEFTDLKFETLLDRVRILLKGPRPAATPRASAGEESQC